MRDFPTIDELADELRAVNRQGEEGDEGGIEVRLQVVPEEGWQVWFGDPGYDTDHSGYWGASVVPGNGRRFNARATARDMIAEARESFYQDR